MEFHMTDACDETFPHMDFTLDSSLLMINNIKLPSLEVTDE